MEGKRYYVPFSLGMPTILSICRDFASLPPRDTYIIDFSSTQHFEPFGMLMMASAVRQLRKRVLPDGSPPLVYTVGRTPTKQGHAFAHRMGFWWSIGDESDLPTVSRTPTSTTIPITRLGIEELYSRSAGADPIRSETVSRAAGNLATTLVGSESKDSLWHSLAYSFREIFRNIIEHSQADAIWYTAQTRPSMGDIQVAILDTGRGIRASLADNALYSYRTDLEALRAALLPGVSRNTGKERSVRETQKLRETFPHQDPQLYDNSGYGLTLTSSLAKEAGQFAIVSGATSLAYVNQTEAVMETNFTGTAVRMVLHSNRVDGALDRAHQRAERQAGIIPSSRTLVTASMALRLGIADVGQPTSDPSAR